MNPSDTHADAHGAAPPPGSPDATAPVAVAAPVAAHQTCDECGAPVEEEQRYCVACGAHRRHVNDPAGRYLSEASARARNARAAGTARRVRRAEGRARGLGIALALALIPAAAAVGVVLGRSSNNDDAQLVQALTREQTAADRSGAATTTSGASTSTSTHGSTSTGAAGRPARHKTTAGHHKAGSHHAKTPASHAATSTTASSIPTKPTAAQKATGAKVTAKVQKSTGKSYVSGQSGLPSTVVVP